MERCEARGRKLIILINRKAPQNLPANTLTLWSMCISPILILWIVFFVNSWSAILPRLSTLEQSSHALRTPEVTLLSRFYGLKWGALHDHS